MNKKLCGVAFLALGLVSSGVAMANDAVLGAVLGGGVGAIVGRSIGGRDGTIIGGALGAAAGAALGSEHREPRVVQRVVYSAPPPVYYAQQTYYQPVGVYQSPPPTVYYVRDGYRHHDRHKHYSHDAHGRHRGGDERR